MSFSNNTPNNTSSNNTSSNNTFSNNTIANMKDLFLSLSFQEQSDVLQLFRHVHMKNYSTKINDNEFVINCANKQIALEKSSVVLTKFVRPAEVLTDDMIERLINIRDMIVKYFNFMRIEQFDDHYWICWASLFIKDEGKTNNTLFNITKLFEAGKVYINVVEELKSDNNCGSYGYACSSGDVSIIDIISSEKLYTCLINDWTKQLNTYNSILRMASGDPLTIINKK